MADPNMPVLPPEYQAQIDQLVRKQRMAQMLQQRGLNMPAPVQSGTVASKTSPFAAIASMLAGGYGGYMDQQANEGLTKVRQQYNTDESADVAKLLGLPEDQRVNAGIQSQFPRSRKLAEEWQKTQEKQRELKSGVYKDYGDAKKALDTLSGVPVDGDIKPPQQPVVSMVPGPKGMIPAVTNFDIKNVPRMTLGAQGTDISLSQKTDLPKQTSEMATKFLGETLKEKQGKAALAKDNLSSISQTVDALESGAKAGGGEGYNQALRQAAQFFGIDSKDISGTTQLEMSLGQRALDQVKNLKPASDTDFKAAQKIAGNIGTDPTALIKVLAYAQAESLRHLQGYNDYISENQKNITDPDTRNMFIGAGSGFEMPNRFAGPVPYQMEVMRNLQRNGVDITRFKDPSGKPFPADAKFNLDITQGFPGVQKPTSQFVEGQVYKDAQGNKAKYVNGQWVPQ